MLEALDSIVTRKGQFTSDRYQWLCKDSCLTSSGGVLSSLSSNQWCHQGYLETSYSWAISLLHGHCAILHRFQLLYHVMTPSFPGLNCCIQWCHFLTLPDCSSCFNICIYLLSHKIHLTDDYQKSHCVSILWKHQGPSVLVVILLWQVYWWKYFDIWFCLCRTALYTAQLPMVFYIVICICFAIVYISGKWNPAFAFCFGYSVLVKVLVTSNMFWLKIAQCHQNIWL